jgi:hypothetical protein
MGPRVGEVREVSRFSLCFQLPETSDAQTSWVTIAKIAVRIRPRRLNRTGSQCHAWFGPESDRGKYRQAIFADARFA